MVEYRWRRAVAGSMREIIFGLEDSLVSTLGAVTGVAAGTGETYIVILSGLVLIAVESLSMAAGSYLSSKSAAAAEVAINGRQRVGSSERPARAAGVMGVAYLIGGFVPLLPYFFLPVNLSFLPSIMLTVVTLFLVGAWQARFVKRPAWRGGVEMVLISLSAAMLGYVIGRLLNIYGLPA